jgi:hypothetical protein
MTTATIHYHVNATPDGRWDPDSPTYINKADAVNGRDNTTLEVLEALGPDAYMTLDNDGEMVYRHIGNSDAIAYRVAMEECNEDCLA